MPCRRRMSRYYLSASNVHTIIGMIVDRQKLGIVYYLGYLHNLLRRDTQIVRSSP